MTALKRRRFEAAVRLPQRIQKATGTHRPDVSGRAYKRQRKWTASRSMQKSAFHFRPEDGEPVCRRFGPRQRGVGITKPFLRMPHLRDQQTHVHGDSPSIVFFSTWQTNGRHVKRNNYPSCGRFIIERSEAGRSDAGGNTHQQPSSCRKNSSARKPRGNAVSTHT
jgi:hypothetical protein